ncbi:MAG: YjjG family noncanonical pyrimidine nucleotidase [Clostridia bacterium]|nr:YjjG family noncanonical pyrimidine nucleotidase [Clostridia bacterium]
MYKYLLWDIDGTVLDFLASEAYAIRTLFRKYNLGECTEEMLKLYSEINAKYWRMLERNEITKPQVLIGRFLEFFSIIGVDANVAESFNNDYQLTLGDHIEFIENAKEVLLLSKGKFVIAAVTNGTKVAQEKKLRMSGLDKIFDAVFISEDVGAEKPNEQYFNYVFENLGITNKKEVLIIGDSLIADMKGGYNSGIDTCWFNPARNPNTVGIPITYEIDNINKILYIVNKGE